MGAALILPNAPVLWGCLWVNCQKCKTQQAFAVRLTHDRTLLDRIINSHITSYSSRIPSFSHHQTFRRSQLSANWGKVSEEGEWRPILLGNIIHYLNQLVFGLGIKIQSMDSSLVNANLGVLSLAEIKHVQESKALGSVEFGSVVVDEMEKCHGVVRLEIHKSFLVQVSPDNHSIISGFAFDYSVNFRVVRNVSKSPQGLGAPEGIAFMFTSQNNRKVELGSVKSSEEDLKKFITALSRRYLVQLDFHACFKASKVLGRGVTATVYLAERKQINEKVAIKSFRRAVYFASENGNGKKAFEKEFKIMTEVRHPKIIHLHGVFESDNSTYIIMDFLELSLLSWLQKHPFPTPEEAKKIIFQLLQGLAYLHKKGIMHRDLKLQNIMVRKDVATNIDVVIVDLGLSEYWENEKYLYTRCGTPGYVAPEILKIKSAQPSKYDCAVDMFSLGVIAHMLFFKKPVFEGANVTDVIKKNTLCNIDFETQNFKDLGEEGKDFLMHTLHQDPEKRITAAEALKHDFFKPYLKSCQSTELQITESVETKTHSVQ